MRPLAGLLGAAVAMALASCGRVPGVARWYTRADARVLWYLPTSEKVVALTIDDGPSAATTDPILDVLAAHGARATFFLIGSRAEREGEAVRRILREGHEVGNHTLFDVPSAKLPADTFRAHFLRTDSILRSFGARPVWFRPASGRFNEPMLRFLCEQGAVGVLGDVYPFDTLIRSEGFALDFFVERTRPGSILILHDGPEHGQRTAQVLARLLPMLEAAGFRVVTLTELVGEEALAARVARCARAEGRHGGNDGVAPGDG